MARQQLGTPPTNALDIGTKGYIDSPRDLPLYAGNLDAVAVGVVFVNSASSTNTPGVGDGVLETWVNTSNSTKTQRFTSTAQNTLRIRYFNGTSWGAWANPAPAGGSSGDPLRVQTTDPGLAVPGMWVQTYANGDIQLWIEDGT